MCAFAICNRNKEKEVRERESAREKHVVDRTNFQFFFFSTLFICDWMFSMFTCFEGESVRAETAKQCDEIVIVAREVLLLYCVG